MDSRREFHDSKQKLLILTKLCHGLEPLGILPLGDLLVMLGNQLALDLLVAAEWHLPNLLFLGFEPGNKRGSMKADRHSLYLSQSLFIISSPRSSNSSSSESQSNSSGSILYFE